MTTKPSPTPDQLTVRIRTERLSLRPIDEQDVPNIVSGANDLNVVRWTRTMPHPYTLDDAARFVQVARQHADRGTGCILGLECEIHDRLIGVVGLDLDPSRTVAELGYWLARPFWGQGFGFEAARSIVDYGFSGLGLRRIHASCVSTNTASDRILLKLGMQPEGRLRQHSERFGNVDDILIYGLLKDEWGG